MEAQIGVNTDGKLEWTLRDQTIHRSPAGTNGNSKESLNMSFDRWHRLWSRGRTAVTLHLLRPEADFSQRWLRSFTWAFLGLAACWLVLDPACVAFAQETEVGNRKTLFSYIQDGGGIGGIILLCSIVGVSLAIIGKCLGHTKPSTTLIYSRLNIDPVRDAMERATDAILSKREPLCEENPARVGHALVGKGRNKSAT